MMTDSGSLGDHSCLYQGQGTREETADDEAEIMGYREELYSTGRLYYYSRTIHV